MEEFEYKDSVRPCKISSTYHRRENNISQIQFADLFWQHDITSRPGDYSNRFLSLAPHIMRGSFLTRLVKAEIMSPYYGILINTGVGNPTAPSITALGDQRVLPS